MTTDNTVQMLKDALAIIEDEQRWTEGALFEEVDLKADPLCQNTKVCALGALALAAWGPQAVRWERRGRLRRRRGCGSTRPTSRQADRTHTLQKRLLDDAADAGDRCDTYRDASSASTMPHCLRPRANRYAKLKDAFRLAIARWRRKRPQREWSLQRGL
jgi:hypothetical protein